MATKSRTKAQAKLEKRAIKKLRAVGLYTGKVDLRKRPTPHQRSLIRKFSDVVTGKAVVVKPANPKGFAKAFLVKGDKVIVPRARGEKVIVGPRGGLYVQKKRGRREVRSRLRPIKSPLDVVRPIRATIFRVPFNRKGTGIEWRRFTYDGFQLFYQNYKAHSKNEEKFDAWMELVEEEYTEFNSASAMLDWVRDHDMYTAGFTDSEDAGRTFKKKRGKPELRKILNGDDGEGQEE